MPGTDTETTVVSEQLTESTDSDPVSTANESVRIDSTADSIEMEKSHSREIVDRVLETQMEIAPEANGTDDDKQRLEVTYSSGSDDEIVTPQHHSVTSIKPQTYIPVQVADIETQVPSFAMPSPDNMSSAFPPIVPGPLPALAKAPVAAWSKPLVSKSVPPLDRPLDVQPKRFDPSQYRKDTTTSASRRVSSDRVWSARIDQEDNQYNSDSQKSEGPANGTHWNAQLKSGDQQSNDWTSVSRRNNQHNTRDQQSNDWTGGSRRQPATTRRPWSERAGIEPKKRGMGFDTAAYRARHPQKPEPEVRVGLEPIWDSTEWEVITPAPAAPYRPPTASELRAEEERTMAATRARLARDAEVWSKITGSPVEIAEEDPYGGW